MQASTAVQSEGVLVSLDELTKLGRGLEPHARFMAAYHSLPDATLSMPDVKQIVDFSVEQLGHWQSKWLFSPAAQPDVVAQAETNAWERTWEVFSKILTDNVPEIGTTLRRAKDLTVAAQLLSWRLQMTHGGNALLTGVSACSQLLNTIGCRNAAHRLYRRALYPAGSVGRLEG